MSAVRIENYLFSFGNIEKSWIVPWDLIFAEKNRDICRDFCAKNHAIKMEKRPPVMGEKNGKNNHGKPVDDGSFSSDGSSEVWGEYLGESSRRYMGLQRLRIL